MKKIINFFVLWGFIFTSLNAMDKWGVGGNVGVNALVGETAISNSNASPNIGLYGLYQFSPRLNFKLQAGFGMLSVAAGKKDINTSMIPVEFIGAFSLLEKPSFTPFVHAGIGAINFSTNESARFNDGMVIGGGGFSTVLSSNLSLLVTADMRYTTGDGFNGVTGGMNDGYFSMQTGLTYHFGKQRSDIYDPSDEKVIAEWMETSSDEHANSQVTETEGSDHFEQLKTKIEMLKNELAQKNNMIEELKTRSSDQDNKLKEIEEKLTQIEHEPAPQMRQSVTTNTSYSMSGSFSDVKEKYREALDYFYAKDYETAISLFSELANSFPDHPLASNFVYWIGESYYNTKQYSAAIDAFENVMNFNKSYKFDDALIMLGLSYLKIGDNENANRNFQSLLDQYPDSEFVEKARKYIEQY